MPEKADASRLEKMRQDGIDPVLPEIDAPYLVEYLMEVGPIMADGPLTAQEIQSWQEQIGIELHPWEFRMLLRLSREYMAQSQKSKAKLCPPPFGELQRSRNLDKKLDSFLA